MAHARRKIHDVHARAPTDITTEALQRIGELYAIEAEVRGCSAEQRLAARKARAAPLMQSLIGSQRQLLRDVSHELRSPLAHRLSVRTFVMEQNKSTVKEALLRELLRGGQVYYLHNDVKTIEASIEYR